MATVIEPGVVGGDAVRRVAHLLVLPEDMVLGKIVRMWTASQKAERASGTADEIAFWLGVEKEDQQKIWIEALSDPLAGFITSVKNGEEFVIKGNKKHIKKVKELKRAARRGGEVTRSKYKQKPTQNPIQDAKPNGLANGPPNEGPMPGSKLNEPKLNQAKLNQGLLKNIAEPIGEVTPAEVKPAVKADGPTPTALAWRAYKAAYEKRWQESPVWNAKLAGQFRAFVGRIPLEAVPFVIEFYLTHTDSFYVKSMHPVGLLLRDAEKLHTEWKRGIRMTSTQARHEEKSDYHRSQLERIARGEL